jgi:hypothetical protein
VSLRWSAEPLNKRIEGVSACALTTGIRNDEFRSQAANNVQGTEIARFHVLASSPYEFDYTEDPIILTPGHGLIAAALTPNTSIFANYGWRTSGRLF